jgi:hypothetical protein
VEVFLFFLSLIVIASPPQADEAISFGMVEIASSSRKAELLAMTEAQP